VHGLVVWITALVPPAPASRPPGDAVWLEVVRVATPPAPAPPSLPAPVEPPVARPEVASATPVTPEPAGPRPPAVASVTPADPSAAAPGTSEPARSSSSPAGSSSAAEGEGARVPDLRPSSWRDSFRAADGPPGDAFAPPPSRFRANPGPSLGDARGGGRYEKDRAAFKAHVAADGSVKFKDKPNWQSEGVSLTPLGGLIYAARFDVTDYVYREIVGDDPYLYEKMKFLDETREVRDGMAIEARDQRLRESLAALPRVLERAWSDRRYSPAERRAVLFQLWDECSESGDEEVLGTARAVRATIVAFVRRRLPAGSSAAYSDAELDALNASRQSRDEFRPYREPE
jgi:hypothetical protein